MSEKELIPEWPQGISCTENAVYDVVQNCTFPLNLTGRFLCEQVDGRKSLQAIAGELCNHFSIDGEIAANDTNSFFYDLNRLFLINLRSRTSLPSYLSLVKTVFYAIVRADIKQLVELWVQSVRTYRLTLDMSGVGRKVQSFLRIIVVILVRVQIVWLIPLACLLLCVILSVVIGNIFIENTLVMFVTLPCSFFIGLIIGLAIHEFGHGLMWTWRSDSKEMAVIAGFSSIKVICPPRSTKDEILIALLGPGLNIAIFTVVTIIASLFPWSFPAKLALLSFAIGAGVFCVSLIGSDGRLIRDRVVSVFRK